MSRLRLLFVKESQNWPRSSGHDVHGYHMMQALAARGHDISLATIIPPTEQAVDGLRLDTVFSLAASQREPLRSEGPAARPTGTHPVWSSWQHRFTEYFGVLTEWAAALAAITARDRFDAVVVVARHLLPLLSAANNAIRVWYPADDPAWHHLSRVKLWKPGTWSEAKRSLVNGLYEHAFRSCIDRVWVVSPADRRAMRLMTACRAVDLVPNGVDAEYYRPGVKAELPASCVFWGRLDFGPNIDALSWFSRSIWPAVKAVHPAATFHLFGFNPTEAVRELARSPGVELHPDLPDLRAEVARRQVVVLPFISGGGIKNKLLEAAALGMPIVCTRRALSGTKGTPPVRPVMWPFAKEWVKVLGELWSDPAQRHDLGAAARRWVVANHSWDAAARTAESGLVKPMRRGAR
jgi:glycosyltransferase involved in cell wall biosynthesis